MAQTLDVLNVARTVQGIAAATVNVTSLALVSAAFPEPKQKARAIGIWTAIASTAMAIGPTLGGLLVQTSGWRSIFLVNVPVGIVAVFVTLRFVAESRDPRERRFDVAGQVLFALAVGSFAYAVIDGPKVGWSSMRIIALFIVAFAALAAFIRYERGSQDPMMDLTLFRDRTSSLAIVTTLSVLFSISGIMSAQRAIGSTVGFAVLGSILAAWLGATLDRDLAAALPDHVERSDVVSAIVKNANPRAYVAEIGPGRPIQHDNAALRDGIL